MCDWTGAFLRTVTRQLNAGSINLVTHNSETTAITFLNFEEICFSMLSDETWMKDKNLTFHHPDPRNCLPVNGHLTCIKDEEIYQNTLKETCTMPEDFCLGIKLFIGATYILMFIPIGYLTQ